MPASILVVDDNADNLKLLKYILQKNGYLVDTAVDEKTVTSALQARRPSLILMDVQLPGVDGLELTSRLKADPQTRDIVIVAVTAYSMKRDEERALAAGCDGYIPKPINTRTLPGMVAEYLARAQAVTTEPQAASGPDAPRR